jgi:alcohol dehydrogenase class IV
MYQYNYPTTILLGQGALKSFCERLKEKNHKRILIVSDRTLTRLGIVDQITGLLSSIKLSFAIYDDTRPNPIEEDVEKGVEAYKSNGCDSLIAIGGGSPMDVAKVIKIMASNPSPLSQYDDALGGDRLITHPMPPLYAIPTTAGTGSEVGRSGVIIMRGTGRKTIFFHPDLMPRIAVLEPALTAELPPHITAATGIDAFSHCLEAYFASGFHPIADGIALQGIELILTWLPAAYEDGKNLEAREKMQIAAAMGAAAFQKGLGMVHSLAHPLSSMYDIHHGLANALMFPAAMEFLENADLSEEQRRRISKVRALFAEVGLIHIALSECLKEFIPALGIEPGLCKYKVPESDIEKLSAEAFHDGCHASNMIPVTKDDLLKVYRAAM